MREIKFRGINAVTEEMICGQLIKTSTSYKTSRHGFTDCHIVTNNVDTSFHSSEHSRGLDVIASVVKPETVGQFTGLKDKNGVEIYEGDIVSGFDHYGDRCWNQMLVVYESSSFGLNTCGARSYKPFCEIDGISWQVIGNIHQNPDLIN